MRFTISAVNQLGVYKTGLIGKVDLIDLAILDYIRVWSNSETAIKNEEGAAWIDCGYLVSEMPILNLSSRQGVAKRIKKLEKLNLLTASYDPFSRRLFIKLNHLYTLISEQKNEGGLTTTVVRPATTVVRPTTTVVSAEKNHHQGDGAISSDKSDKKIKQRVDNHSCRSDNHSCRSDNSEAYRSDILLTDILKTETKKENNKEKKTASKTTSKNESKTAETKTTKNKHDDEDRSQGIWYKNVNIEQALNEGISEACIKSYITFRTSAKAPITDHAFSLMLKSALKAPSVLNMTAEDAINYTVQAGWKKVDLNWIKNSQQRSQRNNAGNADLFRSGFDDKPQQQSHLTKAASQDDASKFLSNVG